LKFNKANFKNDKKFYYYVKAIPARHVLVVADSCFSGTLDERQL
jgi:hypothetical protein